MKLLSENEKLRGCEIWKKKLYLREFMQNTGGIDLGFSGYQFTWNNKQEGMTLIKERLDRGIANILWMEQNPKASVWHMRKEESNHCPILITFQRRKTKKDLPFRFFEIWTSESSSIKLVEDAWNSDVKEGMHNHRLNRSLRVMTRALQKWNREVFGYAHTKIKELERELEILQETDKDWGRQYHVAEELRNQRSRLESINRQKSCELWLKARTQNANFFLLSTVIRRRRNIIDCRKEGEEWMEGEEEIVDYFKTKFEDLFTSNHLG